MNYRGYIVSKRTSDGAWIAYRLGDPLTRFASPTLMGILAAIRAAIVSAVAA